MVCMPPLPMALKAKLGTGKGRKVKKFLFPSFANPEKKEAKKQVVFCKERKWQKGCMPTCHRRFPCLATQAKKQATDKGRKAKLGNKTTFF